MALSLSEISNIERLEKKLRQKVILNQKPENYYYGNLTTKDLGVSTPPRFRYLNTVLGWGAAAVDTLDERVKFQGFYSPNNNVDELNRQFRENFLEVLQRPASLDAFITGIGFISTGMGDQELGEPDVIYRSESPNELTGDYNIRTLSMDSAIKLSQTGNIINATLWLADRTVTLVKDVKSKTWYEVERDEHELGFVPISPIINGYDSKYRMGRTEITTALKGHIDEGMRVLLGASVAREFFALPLRALTGGNPDDFKNEDGSPMNVWDLIAGKVMNIPYNAVESVMPTFEQLPGANPENIMNLIPPLARLAAREIGVPPSYFGFETANPTAADAIILADGKVIAKAKNRIPERQMAWKQAFGYGQRMLYGTLPDEWDAVEATFMRPETPTPAAAADRMSKMNAMGVFEKSLPEFVYRELGMREVEILQLKQYLQTQQGTSLIQGLINAPITPGA